MHYHRRCGKWQRERSRCLVARVWCTLRGCGVHPCVGGRSGNRVANKETHTTRILYVYDTKGQETHSRAQAIFGFVCVCVCVCCLMYDIFWLKQTRPSSAMLSAET